jgi:hypothetical protein
MTQLFRCYYIRKFLLLTSYIVDYWNITDTNNKREAPEGEGDRATKSFYIYDSFFVTKFQGLKRHSSAHGQRHLTHCLSSCYGGTDIYYQPIPPTNHYLIPIITPVTLWY